MYMNRKRRKCGEDDEEIDRGDEQGLHIQVRKK